MKHFPRLALFAILTWPVLTAGSCATMGEPTIRTVEVKVPVRTPCTLTPPAEPDFADTDDALRQAPNHVERVKLLLIGRLQRIAHDAELHAYAQACAR